MLLPAFSSAKPWGGCGIRRRSPLRHYCSRSPVGAFVGRGSAALADRVAFLDAVADRLGFLRPARRTRVAWGDFRAFHRLHGSGQPLYAECRRTGSGSARLRFCWNPVRPRPAAWRAYFSQAIGSAGTSVLFWNRDDDLRVFTVRLRRVPDGCRIAGTLHSRRIAASVDPFWLEERRDSAVRRTRRCLLYRSNADRRAADSAARRFT